jgi:Raf kinase inhibitor-like YbhB/YbcL family protein
MPTRRQFLAVAGGVVLAGCGSDAADDTPTGDDRESPPDATGTHSGQLSFSSGAFDAGGTIPETYTGVGEDVSPPLTVQSVPQEAASLALVVDDPDAPDGTFVHWLLWNVPAGIEEIPERIPQRETVSELDGARQGTNDFGEVGYRGPLPPAGDDPHTYRFTMTALDTTLDLPAGATRDELEAAMDENRVVSHLITGSFGR